MIDGGLARVFPLKKHCFQCCHLATLLLSATALIPVAIQAGTADPILASWVQYVVNGVEVRAVTTDSLCPALEIEGRTVPMSVRAMPDEKYPNRVCTAPVPNWTSNIVLAGKPLPAPVAGYRISMGCTGL